MQAKVDAQRGAYRRENAELHKELSVGLSLSPSGAPT